MQDSLSVSLENNSPHLPDLDYNYTSVAKEVNSLHNHMSPPLLMLKLFCLCSFPLATPETLVQNNSAALFGAIAVIIYLVVLVVTILGAVGAVAFRRYYTNFKAGKASSYFQARTSYSIDSSMSSRTTDSFFHNMGYNGHSLFQLGQCISRSRYSQIHVVTRSDQTVALKSYRPEHEKFWLAELNVYNTAQLVHNNILQFIAGGNCILDSQCSLYLVTEYHTNGSLLDYLSQNTVSLTTMLCMGASFASGLAHLHHGSLDISSSTQSKPVLAHCNISSSNILVKTDLTCCIADFKLAVFKDINSGVVRLPGPRKLYGSTRYSAPEVLDGDMECEECDFESLKQADIYAVGLVLWEMCRRCTVTNGEDICGN